MRVELLPFHRLSVNSLNSWWFSIFKKQVTMTLICYVAFHQGESTLIPASAVGRGKPKASRLQAMVGRPYINSCAIARIVHTVLQFRSVIGTPSNFSAFAASLDLPIPSGACR